MSVTDLNTLIAGMIGPPTVIGKDATTAEAAGIPHTPWYTAGLIGAGAAPGGGLNGATFSGVVNGGIGMPAAVTGKLTYLERALLVHAGNIGLIQLVDRLWGNVPVVTTTGAQAITSPTWPLRDTAAASSGAGVFLALECSSATGNVGAITNTTVSYTNSAGTAGRTATLASFPATAVAGTRVAFSLQAGDIGVRSVQSITLGTSYASGAIHLTAFRHIADIPVPSANIPTLLNFMDLGLPTIWDSSVLQLVYWPTATACGAVSGSFTYAQA